MTTSLVSAAWATTDDLPPNVGLATPLPMSWDEFLFYASEVLYELTGRQWRGSGTSRVQMVRTGGATTAPVPGWVPIPVLWPGIGTLPCGWEATSTVQLPSTPVTSVDEVTIGGTTVDPATYVCDPAGFLERLGCDLWPLDGSLFVTYTHGIAPPLGGVRACVSLAIELAKAAVSDGSCRLRNFQTITREGVTMAAVNLREALTVGMTGLYEVDLFIRSVNPQGLKSRGKAWSPDHGRTRRVSTGGG
jgi:hypothetical protein